MAKTNSAVFLQESITTAKSFLRKSKSSLIEDKSLKVRRCTIVTKQMVHGLNFKNECCVVIALASNTFHCFFTEGSDCCVSVITYIDDLKHVAAYRNYFNDNFFYEPNLPDCWLNEKDKLFINIFHDKEIGFYALGFMIANYSAPHLSMHLNTDNYVIN